ncbi:MAG: enoyl-CoA hydratase/isomerase family protein [Dehalococcoidia bacterium]|nr:enoyl-CoA hydratase/isomerase family protein [Dehalococcoidia bacterium]
MGGFQTITYSVAGGIAYVALNRPHVLNAYNVEMRDELYQALEAVRDDNEVSIGVLRGEGRAFCVGADLTEFGTAPSQIVARDVRWERDIWGMFLSISKPLIASIHGYCLGSGVEIALLCDIRIASDDTVFGMPEVSLGMIPAAGGTQTLPRTIGISRALEMLLVRNRFGASEALGLGLVTRVVERGGLVAETEATARRFVSMNRGAVRAVKAAVWQGADLPLDSALDLETRLALRSMATREN